MKQEKQKYFIPSQNLLAYVNKNFHQENAKFKARIKNKADESLIKSGMIDLLLVTRARVVKEICWLNVLIL